MAAKRNSVGSVIAVVVCLVAVIVVASPALAGSGGGRHNVREGAHPACHGLTNAYAHGAPVAEVAEAHGCDLTGITPAEHPNDSNADADDDNKPATDADGDGDKGPPADVVAAKCDRIAAHLEAANARDHGKSAAAFARQAEHWSCPD